MKQARVGFEIAGETVRCPRRSTGGGFRFGNAPQAAGAARAGYTIVEVLITLVILAILAGVMVPAIRDRSAARLRGAALILERDIQYVQNEAISRGDTLRIEFLSDTSYRVVDPDGGPGGQPIVLRHPQPDYPAHGGNYIVDFTDPGPLQGVEIASANFGGLASLEFGKYGEPTANGEVVLRSNEYQVTISVSPTTGIVSLGSLEPAD